MDIVHKFWGKCFLKKIIHISTQYGKFYYIKPEIKHFTKQRIDTQWVPFQYLPMYFGSDPISNSSNVFWGR